MFNVLWWMLGVIILVKSMVVRETLLYKWQQSGFIYCPKLVSFIIPVKNTSCVAPRAEIPPQIYILIGCFALCFNTLDCIHLRKQILLCCSSWTVDSSQEIVHYFLVVLYTKSIVFFYSSNNLKTHLKCEYWLRSCRYASTNLCTLWGELKVSPTSFSA